MLNSESIRPATSKPTSKLPAHWQTPKPPWRLRLKQQEEAKRKAEERRRQP